MKKYFTDHLAAAENGIGPGPPKCTFPAVPSVLAGCPPGPYQQVTSPGSLGGTASSIISTYLPSGRGPDLSVVSLLEPAALQRRPQGFRKLRCGNGGSYHKRQRHSPTQGSQPLLNSATLLGVADNFLESIMWSPTDIMYSPIRKLYRREQLSQGLSIQAQDFTQRGEFWTRFGELVCSFDESDSPTDLPYTYMPRYMPTLKLSRPRTKTARRNHGIQSQV